MNKTVALVGAVVVIVATLAAFVWLNTGGRSSDEKFNALALVILTQLAVQLVQLGRTEHVSTQVNGRFSQQQEITRKALDAIPPEHAAQITKDAVAPPPEGPNGVESATADQPPAGPAGQRGHTSR